MKTHCPYFFALLIFLSFPSWTIAANARMNDNLIEVRKGQSITELLPGGEIRNYLRILDASSGKTMLLKKNWLTRNPDKVTMTKDYALSISINARVLLIRDEVTINAIAICTNKRFPRPFRPSGKY